MDQKLVFFTIFGMVPDRSERVECGNAFSRSQQISHRRMDSCHRDKSYRREREWVVGRWAFNVPASCCVPAIWFASDPPPVWHVSPLVFDKERMPLSPACHRYQSSFKRWIRDGLPDAVLCLTRCPVTLAEWKSIPIHSK